MAKSKLELRRMPALLGLLLAALIGASPAPAPAGDRLGAVAPAAIIDDQAAADNPERPGETEPGDDGDTIVLAEVRSVGGKGDLAPSSPDDDACPSRRCNANRARAPPSL